MVPWAWRLAQEGGRCVLVDLRGHGQSPGKNIYWGLKESHDMSQLLDELEHQGQLAPPVAVLGDSSGAALALRWKTLDPRVGTVVAIAGMGLSFKQISDQPPEVPKPSKPRIIIKLDTKLLDACAGQYGFPPDAAFPTGIKLTIWRQGDQLAGRAVGKNGGGGEFDLYPESETHFFLKIHGAQLTFIKNDKGETTAVIHHIAGLPDSEGKKLNNERTHLGPN